MDFLGMLGAGLESVGADLEESNARKRKRHEELLEEARRRDDQMQSDHRATKRMELAHELDQQATMAAEGRAADRARVAKATELEDIERRALSLPAHLQDAFIANGGRVVDPRDLMTPEELRDFEMDSLERELKLRRQYERPPASQLPPPNHDDPAMPRGVRAYVADIASRYDPSRRDEALNELRGALPNLFADHPSLDNNRLMREFNGFFGQQDLRRLTAEDDDAWMYGASTPVTSAGPTAAPGQMPAAPAPQSTPVMAPPPSGGGDLVARAEQLLTAIRSEQDPARQAQLRTELAQLRTQLGSQVANANRGGGR